MALWSQSARPATLDLDGDGYPTMFCAACKREIEQTGDGQACPSCGAPAWLDAVAGGRLRLDERIEQDGVSACYDATWFDGDHERPVRARYVSFRVRADEDEDEPDFEGLLARRAAFEHPTLPTWIGARTVRVKHSGELWIVHARVDGLTIEDPEFVRPSGQLQVLAMLNELSVLLAQLHAADPPLVHGKLSPKTILRRAEDRRFMVLDLGTNVSTLPDVVARSSKQANDLIRSAPELVFTDPSPASDVWGLGLAALVMLTGATPSELRGTGGRLRWQDRAAVNPAFGALLERMVAPRPHKRISDGQALAKALSELRPQAISQVTDAPTRRMSSEELHSELGISGEVNSIYNPAEESGEHSSQSGTYELASIAGEIGGSGSNSGSSSRRSSSSSRRHVGSSRRRKRDPDAPVMRPEDLSRELSEAQRTILASTKEERKRVEVSQTLIFAAVALMAAGITWLLVLISQM